MRAREEKGKREGKSGGRVGENVEVKGMLYGFIDMH